MKAKLVICVVKGHAWVVGRVADRWARDLVPGKKSYHNRACTRCGAEQWNAEEIEKEAERIVKVKQRLGSNQGQPVANTPCDPDEFP